MAFPDTTFTTGTTITSNWLNAVNDKCMETVSVKDFGAVGDGVTDDTAAIQAALNTGKFVYGITGETYLISSTLIVTGTGFDGQGCIFKEIDGGTGNTLFSVNVNNVHITNFTVIHNPSANNFKLIVKIINSENSVVDYLRIIGNRSVSEYSNLGGLGAIGGHTKNITIQNNYLYQTGSGISYCADGYSGNNNKVLNNTLIDCKFNIAGTGKGAFISRGNVVSGNTIKIESYPSYMGIEDFSGSSSLGLYNTQITDNVITGSLSVACEYFAISAVSKGAIVSGNVITDWYNTTGIVSALEVAGQTGTIVSNNRITWTTAPDATRGYCMFTSGNTGYGANIIEGNNFSNASTGIWLHNSGISETIVSGNYFSGMKNREIDVDLAGVTIIENNIANITIPATAQRAHIGVNVNSKAIISGNYFTYASSSAQATYADHGILAAGPCSIINNTFDMGGYTFATSYGVYSNGALTPNVIIANNRFLGGMGMNYQQYTNLQAQGNIVSGSQLGSSQIVLGFYDTKTPITKPTITGSKGGNAALDSLITQLSNLGLVTNGTT